MCGAKSFGLKRLSFGVAAIWAVANAMPAFAAQGQADAQLALVKPLSFILVEDLNFGKVIPANVAGTVTIDPLGNRTATNGVVLAGNTHQVAQFAGDGTNGQRVDISLGSNSIQITGPGAPMTVRNFVIGSTPTAILTTTPQRFRINSATGIFQFPVGATLDVGANQVAGTYTGTWTVTLQYQ
jgi:hypothetical protein